MPFSSRIDSAIVPIRRIETFVFGLFTVKICSKNGSVMSADDDDEVTEEEEEKGKEDPSPFNLYKGQSMRYCSKNKQFNT